MKKNMGMIDRLIRTVLALVVVVLYVAKQITGTAAIILGILAVVFLFSSFQGFSPHYVPFKIQ